MNRDKAKKELIIVKAGDECPVCAETKSHKHRIREDGYINVRAEPFGGQMRQKKKGIFPWINLG